MSTFEQQTTSPQSAKPDKCPFLNQTKTNLVSALVAVAENAWRICTRPDNVVCIVEETSWAHLVWHRNWLELEHNLKKFSQHILQWDDHI